MRWFALLCLFVVGCGAEDMEWGLDDALDEDSEQALGAVAHGGPWVFQDAARQCGTYVLPTPNPSGTCRVAHATVRNYAQTVHVGSVDVSACVARVVHGYKLPFRHDGTVFRNAEHRLPDAPQGFYHEYVDPTPGLQVPGPQRIVLGGERAWYYTPDHYETFLPVECSLNALRD
jgi:guanyl-specific ribonuclease Sa